MEMDGMTRRALTLAIRLAREELEEASQLYAAAAADASNDGDTAAYQGAAQKRGMAAKDRMTEANLALDWLIEQALYPK
jgi:hypothetical protein